jgi:enamine deaminase RidA (YjgF/YER057c/UK114 family)
MTHESRLASLDLVLPPPPKPIATYTTIVQHGALLYTACHGPLRADGSWLTGKLGATLDIAAGREAARLNGLAMLATLRAHLGSLDRIVRIIKVLGFVNATPEFTDHPQVINGFSDLMVEVFGEAGIAARSAVGAPSLPAGIAVEVEAIFAVA